MGKRADNVCEFIEAFCSIKPGVYLKLEPWQIDFLQGLYPDKPGAERTVTRGLLTCGRKNAKTTLMAALGIVHSSGPEAIPGTEIRAVATSIRQAGFTYAHMVRMIQDDPDLNAVYEITESKESLWCTENYVGYETISSRVSSSHGDDVAFWIYDELAQASNLDLYDSLEKSGGAVQSGALGVIASTYSSDVGNPLGDIVAMVQVGQGAGGMKHWHSAIYTADPEKDPYDWDNIKAANPNLGVSLTYSSVEKEIEEAKQMPSRRAHYRAYRLNQNAGDSVQLCDPLIWNQAAAKLPQEEMLAELEGERCRAGLDLSDTKDLTALVLYFPDHHFVACDAWLPRETLTERSREDRMPYAEWAEMGHLRTIPGPVIRHEQIYRRIEEIASTFTLTSLRYDRYRMDRIKMDLEENQIVPDLVAFGQGYKSMSPAIERFEQLLLQGDLRHGSNPVLSMGIYNCRVKENPTSLSDERSPTKMSRHQRIDPAVALLMAVADLDEKAPAKASWLVPESLIDRNLEDFAHGNPDGEQEGE